MEENDMPIGNSKVIRLVSVLAKNPAEFRERALTILDGRLSRLTRQRPSYVISERDSVIVQLSSVLGRAFGEALRGPDLADMETRVRQRMESLPTDAPFGSFHNGDPLLARFCYAVVRALEPKTVLETGVCYGVGSAFTLAALESNHRGKLHSVDLPPLGRNGSKFVGWAVPDGPLKARWQLHVGTSRVVLPGLLQRLEEVDMFIHDSLHTYRNMRMEFETVWPHIRQGGILISDDIQDNAAFQELAGQADVALHVAVREIEKHSLLGILVKATRDSAATRSLA